jgi:N6-adenosine-specific RNA methylase IME4
VSRAAHRIAINASVIEQERETYTARKYQGGSIADLQALIASGQKFGGILIDAPWPYETYSGKGKQRSAERHFDCMTLAEIKALPLAALAAEDCALFAWMVWPLMPVWNEVIKAWGFEYETLGFDWFKTKPGGEGWHWGMGHHSRANPEPCLLATRGSPLRLNADVHSVSSRRSASTVKSRSTPTKESSGCTPANISSCLRAGRSRAGGVGGMSSRPTGARHDCCRPSPT